MCTIHSRLRMEHSSRERERTERERVSVGGSESKSESERASERENARRERRRRSWGALTELVFVASRAALPARLVVRSAVTTRRRGATQRQRAPIAVGAARGMVPAPFLKIRATRRRDQRKHPLEAFALRRVHAIGALSRSVRRQIPEGWHAGRRWSGWRQRPRRRRRGGSRRGGRGGGGGGGDCGSGVRGEVRGDAL